MDNVGCRQELGRCAKRVARSDPESHQCQEMNLHLFSTPGENDISYIVEASRLHLENKDDPIIAYMPLASLYAEQWLEFNQTAFKGLARLKTINAELMAQKEIENILRDAALVYIPGGNTFL